MPEGESRISGKHVNQLIHRGLSCFGVGDEMGTGIKQSHCNHHRRRITLVSRPTFVRPSNCSHSDEVGACPTAPAGGRQERAVVTALMC